MELWQRRIQDIAPLDPAWKARARQRLLEQTRPEGSLGELERALEHFVAIQKKDRPSAQRRKS